MRLSVLALCAALAMPAAAVRSEPPAPAATAAPHLRGGLTPEERFLYMKQVHGPDWRNLPTAQRCERRQKMRQERKEMAPAALRQLKQKLDAQWKALPAAEQKRIEQRIANRQERREEGKSRQHQSRCAGIQSHTL